VVDLKLQKNKPGRQFQPQKRFFTRVGMILQDAKGVAPEG
jgi:hypothetical protein